MYFRKMMEPPEKLIVNGSPIFGTFEGPISKLDIRGIKHPYGGMPLPKTISNFRIKSSLTFMFNIGTHIGNITFFDAKIFGFAEVVFWDKLTGRKYSYKTIMGPRRRFIPHNLEQGFCASFNKKRYIRISWDHARDRISMIFNMAGDSARPSVQAAFTGRFSDSRMCEVTQNTPIFSKRRCSASYFATPQIHGSLTIDKTKITDAQTYTDVEGQGLFFINRSYYAFITEIQFVTGAGIIDGKQVSFIIANTCRRSLGYFREISDLPYERNIDKRSRFRIPPKHFRHTLRTNRNKIYARAAVIKTLQPILFSLWQIHFAPLYVVKRQGNR